MKIRLLLQREPFGEILEQTLSRYLTQRHGQTYRVRWYEHGPDEAGSQGRRDEQLWLCNPHLDVIFPADADSASLVPTRELFTNTPFHWRRPFQWSYVQLATHWPTMRWLARAAMGVAPPVPGSEYMVLWGGNNRLHLVDVSGRRVWSVLKQGFDPASLEREIMVRQHPGGWPVPELLDVAPDGTWFEERYVAGRPLNRLSPGRDIASFQEKALSVLRRWVNLTRTEQVVVDYAEQLAEQIRGHLMQVSLLTQEERIDALSWMDAVLEVISRLKNIGGHTLPVAVGHGDFQPGNIIVDENDQLWLIDWENLDRRQLLYDVLVFGLPSRQPSGLPQRLEHLLSRPERLWRRPGFQQWPELRECTPGRLRLIVAVFLLEEMAFYLAESRNPLFRRMSPGWAAFQNERDRALSVVAQM